MNNWAYDLETKLYSVIKQNASEHIISYDKNNNPIRLIDKYPNIRFTVTDRNETNQFPTVYLHELPGVEVATDNENNKINAIVETIEITVYCDTTQNDAKRIMAIIIDEFKTLGFTINKMPEFNNLSTVYRSVARARKTICSGDIL